MYPRLHRYLPAERWRAGLLWSQSERNEQVLVDKLLKRGVKHVIVLNAGRVAQATCAESNETHYVAGFSVPVVIRLVPGLLATLLVCSSMAPRPEALRWANASGSLALANAGPWKAPRRRGDQRFLAAQHPDQQARMDPG